MLSRGMPRLRAFLLVAVLLAVTATAGAGELPIDAPIVFVKQAPVGYTFATISDVFGNFQGYDPGSEQPVGGNLFRLDPDGTLTNLTQKANAAVRDPEVSVDGERVLFSMKVGRRGRWQVYEIGADGTGLQKVSRDARHHDLDPAYLPNGRVVFTTDRRRWADGYENLPSAQLATMKADGTAVRVLKEHPAGQFNPLVGSDGMIYFTQWDFHDRRRSIAQDNSDFDVNRFLLWKIFADGSGLDHPHFGAHTVFDFDGGYTEIRELPGEPGIFVGVLADEFFTYGAGAIVRLEPRANQDLDEPIFLTKNVFGRLGGNDDGRWRSPYPLKNGGLVASYAEGAVFDRRSKPTPRFDLVVLDADGSRQRLLYSDPDLWSWQPVEVAARATPTLAAGKRIAKYPYAVVNSFDVTLRGRNEDEVLNGDFQRALRDGQAKKVRFYRENVRSRNVDPELRAHKDPDVQVLGTAPIRQDGSFAAVVPADMPIAWELLDGNGKVLVRERFGAELERGEVRQCRGCHTPHGGRRGNETNLALANPTNLSGKDVDTDGNGIVDLLEALGLD